jgi:hypothetical protein
VANTANNKIFGSKAERFKGWVDSNISNWSTN